MTEAVNIASLIVQCRPERLADVCAEIRADATCEIHATDPCGKIVVVIEVPTTAPIAARADSFSRIAGVLSCNLVYHAIDEGADEPIEEYVQ
ncbi:chaperone NapD [Oceanibacterium hippocampi]|uniref:Chaperone NapD n=1 Tax=Oceanibacterium hippocampi TaxID=745714 RepID=A0A1Y5TFP0_9PROT|nr:chaperone NapD [Oceanibacterium hippocampi]SLN62714.1 assembly protein for periplasmic nitrate reductase [Oceanibacterium hippocampi]